MQRWLMAALAAAWVSLPAAAQTSAPSSAPLEACIGAAGASLAALQGCKGVVAEPCIEAPGGETTAGMVQCFGAEAEGWGALLEGAIARAQSDVQRAPLLNVSQMAWATWRDAECQYQASIYAGGSLARVVAASCVADLTADRAVALIHAERIVE